jgi:ATP-dependent helicase HepA
MDVPQPGQRWASDSEPELGLGIILHVSGGRVEVHFPAAGEHRQYAIATAPLRRVRFARGERIATHAGVELLVEGIEERQGALVYRTGQGEIAEADLADSAQRNGPEDRLLSGRLDDLQTYELRAEAMEWRSACRRSPARGFAGARIDLIPHQLSIAQDVSRRLVPRVLLADEVGLGKTIEAGLILHRLHLTGRAERVLILVPEPLIHQWFIELLRRFNLLFSLFDEERCESIQTHNPKANPFLDSQLVLCSIQFLARNAHRSREALEAGWDLLIVDEAHHLEWHPDEPSPEYALVESFAREVRALLLLTATPQQLGLEGHFARLRLLDPDRYADFQRFVKEGEHYEEVARAVDGIMAGKDPRKSDLFSQKSERVRGLIKEVSGGGTAEKRAELVDALLDEFGMGRVMFRNTRAALSGFPKRKPMLAPLDGDGLPEMQAKVKWVVALLKRLRQAKALLICRSRELAEEIARELQREMNVAAALFHEGLTLMQRDRNAAWFAEDDGARILICSEIGSEGRNFQFAHHLVLFDLPEDPELLEQRIGRLDRIGQTATIQIHVPFLRGTGGEVLARFYGEGLNAFAENVHGAGEIMRRLRSELEQTLQEPGEERIEKLIAAAREERRSVVKAMKRGHDRLLELQSCKPREAAKLIGEINALDDAPGFEDLVLRVFDHLGVQVEELGSRSYLLRPGHGMSDALPSLPVEGLSVTLDRVKALSRDDIGFLSPDHPLVRGALDALLGGESGTVAFGIWMGAPVNGLLLELCAVVETVAPQGLHADRFLPPSRIRVVVDQRGDDRTSDTPRTGFAAGDVHWLLDQEEFRERLLPEMFRAAEEMVSTRATTVVAEATRKMERDLNTELRRLEDLQEINDHVRPEETAALRKELVELTNALAGARTRLDSARLLLGKS